VEPSAVRALRRRHLPGERGLELTPLVDVALMLVVFLLLNIGMVAPRHRGVPLELPRAASERIPPESDRFLIVVTADGGCFVDGEPLSADELPARAEGRETVVLAVDAGCTHGRVLAIVDRLRAGGVDQVFFAVDRKEDDP